MISTRPSISGAWPWCRPTSRCSVSSCTPSTSTCSRRPTSRRRLARAIGRCAASSRWWRRRAVPAGTRGASVGGRRARLGAEGEGAEVVEAGPFDEVEEMGEVLLGLAREADDEGGAQEDVGRQFAGAVEQPEVALGGAAPAHRPQHLRVAVLERHVDIGEEAALAPHQPQQLLVEGGGIGVEEAEPGDRRRRRAAPRPAAPGRGGPARRPRRSGWCPGRSGTARGRRPPRGRGPRPPGRRSSGCGSGRASSGWRRRCTGCCTPRRPSGRRSRGWSAGAGRCGRRPGGTARAAAGRRRAGPARPTSPSWSRPTKPSISGIAAASSPP